ncbi:MAG: tetratricopeptide repeat protein [Planctomycetota bacterium]|jgi:serine/threonine-protein kinase
MTDRQGDERPHGDDVDEDSLDFVLRKYHEGDDPGVGDSVLEALQERVGDLPEVHLQQVGDYQGAPVVPGCGSDEQSLPSRRRYQMLGKIAHGGMGVVHYARDVELGRDLAMKVLHKRHLGKPGMVHRFVEEAQICGQLQHPGIVPLYELGLQSDHGPYFTMKLVVGKTLAVLLEERSDPASERRRFLSIFEHVCQAMAYAHARGVIHRDLKPSNIMVGAFGEVQVMDWGLAKVLVGEDTEEGESTSASHETGAEKKVETVRSGSTGSHSHAGSVLGTPAYMPPEQARGETGNLDSRSDVFSLGAILCEILTGKPPYADTDPKEIRQTAADGLVSEALRRLRSCSAEEKLVRIAMSCLDPEPESRPRDAGLLARRVTSYLASIDERLRKAELRRAAAEAKAAVEQRARKITLVLASTILLLVLLGGGGYLLVEAERQSRVEETSQAVTVAMEEAILLQGKARSAPVGDLRSWELAIASAAHAASLAQTGGVSEEMQHRVGSLLAALREERNRAEGDRRMVERLDAIRAAWVQDSTEDQDREYELAFRTYGIDISTLDPEEAARLVQASDIFVDLVIAIDNWMYLSDGGKPRLVDSEKLARIQSKVDSDPWRTKLRDAFESKDPERLRELASSPALLTQSPVTIELLAGWLEQAGDVDSAISLLRKAREQHPDDFWINHRLAHCLGWRKKGHSVEALGFARAAVAIRPTSFAAWFGEGNVHFAANNLDSARSAFKKSLALYPDCYRAHNNLATIHLRQGDPTAAIAEYEKALEIRGDYALGHHNLGVALGKKGEHVRSIESFKKAVVHAPRNAVFHHDLGLALKQTEDYTAAIKALQKSVELKQDYVDAYASWGDSLRKDGDVGEATRVLKKALKLAPNHVNSLFNLGLALKDQGQLTDAIQHFRRVLEIDDRIPDAHNEIGVYQFNLGQYEEAEERFRKAIEITPGDIVYHLNLGNALRRQGMPDDALESYRTALEHDENDARAYHAIGGVLLDKYDYEGAIRSHRNAVKLEQSNAHFLNDLGCALRYAHRLDEANEVLRKAIDIAPRYGMAYYNLGCSLMEGGQFVQALEGFRKAIDQAGRNPTFRQWCMEEIEKCDRWIELDERLPAVLEEESAPIDAEELIELARLCHMKQLDAAAVKLYRRAFKSEPGLVDDVDTHHLLDAAVSAALAGSGVGKDASSLDETERPGLRKQAIVWLRARLAQWKKALDAGGEASAKEIVAHLEQWKRHKQLAGVRNKAALSKLPERERKDCEAFWREVGELLKKAASAK